MPEANLRLHGRKTARADLIDNRQHALAQGFDQQEQRGAHALVFQKDAVMMACNHVRQRFVENRERLRIAKQLPNDLSFVDRADERLQRGVVKFAQVRRALGELPRFGGAQAIAHKMLKRAVVEALEAACAHRHASAIERGCCFARDRQRQEVRRAFFDHPLCQRAGAVPPRQPLDQSG